MTYYLYIVDRGYNRDNEQGTPCQLSDHLQDMRDWGGTPDCQDSSESLSEMKRNADRFNCLVYIVSDSQNWRPVYSNNYREESRLA